jgi:hypothetical protein
MSSFTIPHFSKTLLHDATIEGGMDFLSFHTGTHVHPSRTWISEHLRQWHIDSADDMDECSTI